MPPRRDNQRHAALAQHLDKLTEQLANVVQLLSLQAIADHDPRPPANPNHHQRATLAPVLHQDSEDDEKMINNPFAQLPVHANCRCVDNYSWEAGFKVEFPEFAGGLEPEDFIDWFITMEDILNFKYVPPDQRVPLVATHLRGCDVSWWRR